MKRAGIMITGFLMLLLLAACGGGDPVTSGVNNVDVTAPDGTKVAVGNTLSLELTVDADAGVSRDVAWTSSAESIATVDENGVVTGINEGSVTITAKSTADASKSDEIGITVTPAGSGFGDEVSSVEVTTPNGKEVAVGNTLALGVTVEAAAGVSKDVTWDSSSDAIATVNASGVVTGVAEGNVTITATSTVDTSKFDSVSVTVTADGGGGGGEPAVTKVVITPASEQITVGGTAQLAAEVQGDVGVSQNVTWKSNTPSIATVNSTGLVTGESTGTVTITATSVTDPNKSDSATVEVISCTTTALPSTISTDLVLTEACGPYTAGNVTVTALLTIKPGAKIVFSQDARLTIAVGGTIVANGTASQPVVITGANPSPGFWDGIEIASLAANTLDFVEVSYSGSGGYANVFVQDTGSVTLTNSSFTNSSSVGVLAQAGAKLPGFASNTFSGSAEGALAIAPDLMSSLDSSSDYSGNDENYIDVFGGTVETDGTWPDTGGVPFRLGNTTVEAAVTVAPGADFIFRQNNRLTIAGSGSLKAEGTASEHITFAGELNVAGHWDGIEIASPNPVNTLSFVDVSDGGSGNYANVFVQNTGGRVTLTNSSFTNSSSVGVLAQDGAKLPGFSSNTFSGNAEGALLIPPDLMSALDSASDYSGNDKNYIDVSSGTVETDGTWPDTGGVPFRLAANVTVDAAVTVAPGADFIFVQNARLTVRGSLKAEGTASEHITFKGEQAAQGYWDGIEIASGSPDNILDYVEVSDGGSGNYANVLVQDTVGRVTLTNSIITNSSTYGLLVQSGGQTTPDTLSEMLSQNAFSDNALGAVDGL